MGLIEDLSWNATGTAFAVRSRGNFLNSSGVLTQQPNMMFFSFSYNEYGGANAFLQNTVQMYSIGNTFLNGGWFPQFSSDKKYYVCSMATSSPGSVGVFAVNWTNYTFGPMCAIVGISSVSPTITAGYTAVSQPNENNYFFVPGINSAGNYVIMMYNWGNLNSTVAFNFSPTTGANGTITNATSSASLGQFPVIGVTYGPTYATNYPTTAKAQVLCSDGNEYNSIVLS
jgi:hypothetical protein